MLNTIKLAEVTQSSVTGLDAIQRAPIVPYNTEHKCLRIQNVAHCESYEEWGFTEVSEANFGNFQLRKDDIIISRTGGSIGSVMYIAQDYNAVFNNGLIRLRVNRDYADPLFVYYCLKSNQFSKHIEHCCLGNSTQENIRMNDMLEYKIPSITLSLQKKIATLLWSFDEKINNNNDLCTNFKNMTKLLYDYWFVQFDFPDENGRPYKSSGGEMVYVDKIKREIPKNWKVIELGDIIKEAKKSSVQVSEARKKVGNYPFFTSGDDILDFNDYYVDGFNIFLNTGGNADVKSFFGKSAYSTDTWCISADNYSYILYIFLDSIKEQINDNCFAGSGLKHLQKNAFKKIKLVVPPDGNLLESFNNFALSSYQTISSYKAENKRLASLRDWLLPMLMSGQVCIAD